MATSVMSTGVNKQDWTPTVDKAKEAVEKAKATATSVSDLASQAGCAVGAMASQAACDLGKRADDFTTSAGTGIQNLGDQLSKNSPQTGMLGAASQAVAASIKDGGTYIHDAKLSGLADDLVQVVRRNPIPAVLIALGLGWLIASKVRS